MLNKNTQGLMKRVVLITSLLAVLPSVVFSEENDDFTSLNFKVKDYQSEDCQLIFQNKEPLRITNISYWIRMMECSENNSTASNRSQAKVFNTGLWPDTFAWIVLISNGNPSLNERKKILNQLQIHDVNIPNNMRSLVNLIKRTQQNELALQELSEAQDTQLATLSETVSKLEVENQQLAKELADTQLKLEHLADIERQLSLRRQIQNQIEPTIAESTFNDTNIDAVTASQPMSNQTELPVLIAKTILVSEKMPQGIPYLSVKADRVENTQSDTLTLEDIPATQVQMDNYFALIFSVLNSSKNSPEWILNNNR